MFSNTSILEEIPIVGYNPTRMKYSCFILLFCLLQSCQKNGIRSIAMIGRSRLEVSTQLNNYTSDLLRKKMSYKTYETSDTILIKIDHKNSPLDMMVKFKNDTSVYQELNVNCSPLR
jgi:hypothetical protein